MDPIIRYDHPNIDWKKEIAIIHQRQKDSNQPVFKNILTQLPGEFTVYDLLEIVLWRLNCHDCYTDSLVELVEAVEDKPTDSNAELLLKQLLCYEGFGLPMASTILQFINADKFQIYDQYVSDFIRLYSTVLSAPTHFFDRTSHPQTMADLYFKYLRKLRVVSKSIGIPFNESESLFYALDHKFNRE